MSPDAGSRKYVNFSMTCVSVVWKGGNHPQHSRGGRALEIVLVYKLLPYLQTFDLEQINYQFTYL